MSEAAVIEPDEVDERPDLEAIVPTAGTITVDGVECRVRRFKTREFLALMGVLTNGIGPGLADVKIDFDDAESIANDLGALMLLALPNAPDHMFALARTIVEPVDDKFDAQVANYLMDDPDPDVMLELVEIVITQEKDDLSVLAGKVQSMLSRLDTLFKTKKPTAKKTTRGSSGRSRARST